MKLIIQIPCFNEADNLPVTLGELPRHVQGFDTVEWMVIDDGSTDDTARIAREHGVDHIITHISNQGLARAFMTGLDACLRRGADVIVNTDADNQYDARDIPLLVADILDGRADVVIGARPISAMNHFSPAKKMLQKLGSWIVRMASRTTVPDAPSGFRALSRAAAMRVNVFNEYTYTLETIIQAGQNNMSVMSVPVRVNPVLRPSRLMKSIYSYIKCSIVTIIRIFVIYRPFRFFGTLGFFLFLLGFMVGLRFLWFYFTGHGGGHMQSLIFANILIGMGFQSFLVAFIADSQAANRKLMEEVLIKLRTAEYDRPGRVSE